MTNFLDTDETARRLRLSPRTLEKWRVRGEGPEYRKHGKRVYYDEGALERWSDGQRRTSTSDGR